jgi:succinate dehydrogenase / fumarate reductase cytochrome b subunit
MIPLKQVLTSTVGRKFAMALTGAGLVVFVILHLLGNLQFFSTNPDPINAYGAKFKELGPLFYVIEWGLFGAIALHVALGAMLWKKSNDARDSRYAVAETKGGNSRWNLSSGHMLALGVVLGIFIVIHVLQFRYQFFARLAGREYVTMLDGKQVDDLHRLVGDTFQSWGWVFFYMGVMVFLGFHLRHGIWSMFQSLGAMPAAYSNLIHAAAAVVAVLLAAGFLLLPLYIKIVY